MHPFQQDPFKNETFRFLIIGGGAAGYFAAIRAAEVRPEAKVVILEQSAKTLQKVRISGGGRCNVTHACFDPRELTGFYPRGDRALRGPFSRFSTGDTMDWYESRGVPLKIEEDGRIFPVSDRSQSIIDCLEESARKAGVEVILQEKVVQLYPPEEEGQRWKVMTRSGKSWFADALMVAGGSSRSLWDMIQHLGHTIVEPVPSLFTFNIPEPWLHELAGISMPAAIVRIPDAGLEESGPLLITHWGLSGPAVLKLSARGARELNHLNYEFELRVNWIGHSSVDQILEELNQHKTLEGKKLTTNSNPSTLPARLWRAFCTQLGIAEARWGDLRKDQLRELATMLCDHALPVRGKSTFKEEFVTAGGVHLDEVDFKRFESRIHRGLYFAGEILNIDAVTGGFNFQAAWTGGWIAGGAAVES